MSPADASTHKRKASSPEASSPIKEKHDSKKPRTETTEEHQQQHAEDCEDPDCEGCAEGEIILQFETTPSAVELFHMAREETVISNNKATVGSTGLSRMAKALFDKAIEEFEKLEKEVNAGGSINLTDGSEAAIKTLETKVQHAACVVAVGNAMPSFEMLQEGTRMFEELTKKTEQQNGKVLVGLGIAEISQARDLRRQAMKTILLVDEDDEDEPSEEQKEVAGRISKPEAKLAEHAIESFNKGLALLKATKIDAYAQEAIRAAQELEEYGISVDLTLNKALATKTFDSAIHHLESVQSTKPDLVESNADVLSIYGSCLHSKARIVDNQTQGAQNPAMTLVEKAIELLVKAEEMQDEMGDAKTLEALGQAYLMSTGLIEDEDLIMERFDAATENLSRALELDPYNEALRGQVEALQGSDNEEGNGYEDEYEDEGEDDEDVEEDEEEA
ncbi:hypothetical protein BGX28_004108 [Mortierella sp. GBA30]|nr:hypothetical protein BGX28_004108 [Mortierella sp. GBA30]